MKKEIQKKNYYDNLNALNQYSKMAKKNLIERSKNVG